jgi:hypothetical protein
MQRSRPSWRESTKRTLLLSELKENPRQCKREFSRLKKARKSRKRRQTKKMKRKIMMMNKLVLVQFFLVYKAFTAPHPNTTHSF